MSAPSKWKAISTSVYNADCGTGAGGFKPGNDCGKKREKNPKPPANYTALRRAFEDDPDDELNAAAMADWYEEQKDNEAADLVRQRKELREELTGFGRMAGQPIYVAFYWDAYMNGFADEDDGDILTFRISDAERKAFPEIPRRKKRIRLQQSDSGFIYEV